MITIWVGGRAAMTQLAQYARRRSGGPVSLIVGAVLALLTGFSGGRVQAMTTSSIECEIRSRHVAAGVELTGIIRALRPVRGDYSFSVLSEGSGGASNVHQNGLFAASPDEPAVVGAVVVNSGAGSSVSVRLLVHSEDGELCEAAQ